ncbi:MAG TPA: hypothetical protein VFO61_05905 [Alphaproteobacteria bacterium]|nr:hypothetical protein [Alphaproteobacteria bacterium]
MAAWIESANIGGLIFNLIGFVLVARELCIHPGDRPYLGGGDEAYRADYWGFVIVVVGTVAQIVAQILPFLLTP